MHKNFTYGDDFEFISQNFVLRSGKNDINVSFDTKIAIELWNIDTFFLGTCHLIKFKSKNNWNEKNGHLYIAYNKKLDAQDIPKSFTIYFTTRLFMLGYNKT